jgi:hypothetical protein
MRRPTSWQGTKIHVPHTKASSGPAGIPGFGGARPDRIRGGARAEDLRLVLRALGRITGTVQVEELLDVILRDFCIGK